MKATKQGGVQDKMLDLSKKNIGIFRDAEEEVGNLISPDRVVCWERHQQIPGLCPNVFANKDDHQQPQVIVLPLLPPDTALLLLTVSCDLFVCLFQKCS